METSDPQWTAVGALVAGWVAGGVRHAVIAPGSRSTPLALALERHPDLAVQVVLDERSAAFRALGIGQASGIPAIAVCTSGSAAAHFHPAVLEAHHGRVPLIVATANRPPELHDTGAGQTIDQHRLYGTAVRWFAATGVADAATLPTFAPIAARSVAEALGPPAGPVHLDVALREPLVPDRDGANASGGDFAAVEVPRTERALRSPSDALVEELAARLGAAERGVVVAGWGSGAPGGVLAALARDLGWPLLADPISGARVGPNAITTYEALVRTPAFAEAARPDVVLRFGAPLTSKVAAAWLDSSAAEQIVIDPDDTWLDPRRVATLRVVADAAVLAGRLSLRCASGGFHAVNRPPGAWLSLWLESERRARAAIDLQLDSQTTAFDGRLARDLVAGLPDGTHLLVASSMPVRDLEWFAPTRSGLVVHANRGVNGIDGLVSTAVGISVGASAPTVALLGDLALLHDTNGLLGAARSGANLVLVVVDNDGGGIFSFLPQADACPPAEFELLFGTPHGLDLVAVAQAHGVDAVRIADPATIVASVAARLATGGVHVIVVPSDRARNVDHHRVVWEAVAGAVGRSLR